MVNSKRNLCLIQRFLYFNFCTFDLMKSLTRFLVIGLVFFSFALCSLSNATNTEKIKTIEIESFDDIALEVADFNNVEVEASFLVKNYFGAIPLFFSLEVSKFIFEKASLLKSQDYIKIKRFPLAREGVIYCV